MSEKFENAIIEAMNELESVEIPDDEAKERRTAFVQEAYEALYNVSFVFGFVCKAPTVLRKPEGE